MGRRGNINEVRRVIIVALIISIWAGFSFIAKYKKVWLGNEQEMYPGLVLPGFAGVRPYDGHVAYPEYKAVVHYKDGQEKTYAAPDLFAQHPWSKFRSLIYSPKELDIHKLLIDDRVDVRAVCFYLNIIEVNKETLQKGQVLKENKSCFEF